MGIPKGYSIHADLNTGKIDRKINSITFIFLISNVYIHMYYQQYLNFFVSSFNLFYKFLFKI